MYRVRVVIAGNNRVLCELATILSGESDFNLVASCRDGASCIEAIRDLSPQMALLDNSLPGQDGQQQILAAVRLEHLPTQIVFLSSSDADGNGAIAWRRRGAVPAKAAPFPLVEYLRHLASDTEGAPIPEARNGNGCSRQDARESLSTGLTGREGEVMQLVCEGQSNKEIGRQLNLSEGTVKVHLHHIYQKLAIRNRTALATLAARSGTQSPWTPYRKNGALTAPKTMLNGRAKHHGPTDLASLAVRKPRSRRTS